MCSTFNGMIGFCQTIRQKFIRRTMNVFYIIGNAGFFPMKNGINSPFQEERINIRYNSID